MTSIENYVEANRSRWLDELFQLLRQPSISTRNEGVRECASLLSRFMTEAGIRSRVLETDRHPVVYGEILRENKPTLLVYGHYDCQPPEPLEEWTSPPFEPVIRNGKIYGRGTSDNKAQLFTYVKAVEALRQCSGELPLSIKFLFEGEEEIGSPSLNPFVAGHKDLLNADLVVYSDSHIHESGRPLLILGLKGLLYVELTVRTSPTDQHSMRATSIPNPVWRLVWALSTLKGRDNRILIPGFYDDVLEPTPLEREAVARIPYDEGTLLRHFGIREFLPGRKTRDFYHNLVFEPTCNIAGILSGYVGPGSKTVLPATASAKMDIRLVPKQDPDDIHRKLRTHLDAQGFSDISITISQGTIQPSRTPIDHPAVAVIEESVRAVYGTDPVVFPNIGGSGPNYIFTETLGKPCIVIPHATYDQNNHAPNESMDLEGFFKGIRTGIAVVQNLARRL
jgi:acetylornithine deacetylase/succinyl-diaminopimelate desuccinylase-like protein